MCVGTRLHFHELLHDRFHNAKRLEVAESMGKPAVFRPSDEARALYEWLRTQPGLALALSDVFAVANSESAVFTVTAVPGCTGACVCPGQVRQQTARSEKLDARMKTGTGKGGFKVRDAASSATGIALLCCVLMPALMALILCLCSRRA